MVKPIFDMSPSSRPQREVLHRPPPPPPQKPARKIIQIAAAEDPQGGDTHIVALCDDGTLWGMMNGQWYQMPGIPQYG